jgi:hypothetical protein
LWEMSSKKTSKNKISLEFSGRLQNSQEYLINIRNFRNIRDSSEYTEYFGLSRIFGSE